MLSSSILESKSRDASGSGRNNAYLIWRKRRKRGIMIFFSLDLTKNDELSLSPLWLTLSILVFLFSGWFSDWQTICCLSLFWTRLSVWLTDSFAVFFESWPMTYDLSSLFVHDDRFVFPFSLFHFDVSLIYTHTASRHSLWLGWSVCQSVGGFILKPCVRLWVMSCWGMDDRCPLREVCFSFGQWVWC